MASTIEEEIARLRSELDELKAAAKPGSAIPEEGETPAAADATDLQSGLEQLLASHGLSTADFGELWEQLRRELHDLPEKKPLVTALGAFTLGLIVGRISKG